MINVLISDETRELLRQVSRRDGKNPIDTGVRLPCGWLVPFDEETVDRVNAVRLPRETFDQTVVRITREALGLKPN